MIRITLFACTMLAAAFAATGCGYMVGGEFPTEVRTIHIPTFTSTSFRRDFHLELTEAVQKEVQSRTHFRLAKEGMADTKLTGRLVEIRKDVLGETAQDDPRQLQLSVAVEILWEDLNTGRVLAQNQMPMDRQTIQMISTADFAPEVGQSLATAKQLAIQKLAADIVDSMEAPW